ELFVLVTLFAMLISLGLVVDGGGLMRAQDAAAWCAQQAARAGATRLDLAQAALGDAPVLDGPAAVATALQVVAASGMDGTAVVNADGSLTVSCSTEYTPAIVGWTGASWSVTEEATARPVHGVSQPRL
ncbi:MAG: hypothetical protein FWE61_04680, partial [Micrococcales bacterium]|nr:hypothetical protein [Micrococcales bacterium]